jgi:hypothetical protein
MRLAVWLISFASLASCAHGPDVTGCVVDVKNSGFQCYDKKHKDGFFRDLSYAKDLLCHSPEEVESFLKMCKEGKVTPVIQCTYKQDQAQFSCVSSSGGVPIGLPFDQADNYFCVSKKDFKRITERCKVGSLEAMSID